MALCYLSLCASNAMHACPLQDLLVRDMLEGLTPLSFFFKPTLPPLRPGGMQPPQGLIERRMRMNGSWLASNILLAYCILILPQDHFEPAQQGPRTQSHIDKCHNILCGPNWLCRRRILPCTFTHALHMCNIPLFCLAPTGKTPYVMVERNVNLRGGIPTGSA